MLPLEGLSLQEQIFESTIKRKDKAAHVDFYNKLCEILESGDDVSDDDDDIQLKQTSNN